MDNEKDVVEYLLILKDLVKYLLTIIHAMSGVVSQTITENKDTNKLTLVLLVSYTV